MVYRFLERGRCMEASFDDTRAAFDRACEDLETETAAPLEIVRAGETVFSSFDIYTLCDGYFEWRRGTAPHPLGEVRR